ncbi:MAG: FtsX-like permease family protein [Prolixibacteraceae bacterium]|nr:FtsX-like permease family protein [Prolixibacteraceae bacterium]MDI9562898.1 FtsX-like permease family protein [Bacteroidota bacterium]NLS99833.1 FtsX-like permease family protein [Bacteroidales bacterium]OQB80717.1 MAG: Lipoprotein-releasing system transmembrane protein LolE [Bacteroidetes bacterium ADurb.Bin123]HNZ67897.1 FtsX-like permease family protein [Prolixibacteraceae bacterium]
MNLPFFIAKRYLISGKKQHIINIISGIAATGICVGTFALVVVLSVFNGFDGLIKSYFSILDPDLKMVPAQGKFFDPDSLASGVLDDIPGVASYARVIEGNALLTYEGRQFIASMKGVSQNFSEITGIDSLIVAGGFRLEAGGESLVVAGQGVASYLGISLNFNEPIRFYVPRKGLRASFSPEKALNEALAFPAGIFALLEEVDATTVFVPLSFAASLFETGNHVSALEIRLANGVPEKKVRREILEKSDGQFLVKNKYQQHDALYKTMKTEKWATYLILAFILVIASFNILGSLSMLIIDKTEDITILRSMGASDPLIKRIFLLEGWMISLVGTLAGILLGIAVCLVQIRFGLIRLPGEGSFVISAYPVDIQFQDLILIFTVVLTIGFIAAWIPVSYLSRKKLQLNPSARE